MRTIEYSTKNFNKGKSVECFNNYENNKKNSEQVLLAEADKANDKRAGRVCTCVCVYVCVLALLEDATVNCVLFIDFCTPLNFAQLPIFSAICQGEDLPQIQRLPLTLPLPPLPLLLPRPASGQCGRYIFLLPAQQMNACNFRFDLCPLTPLQAALCPLLLLLLFFHSHSHPTARTHSPAPAAGPHLYSPARLATSDLLRLSVCVCGSPDAAGRPFIAENAKRRQYICWRAAFLGPSQGGLYYIRRT